MKFQQQLEKTKQKKVSNFHTIRIRQGLRSNNVSPQRSKVNEDDLQIINESEGSKIGSLLKKIPKTLQRKDDKFVEGCFSYVDQGFQKWKVGVVLGRGNSYVKKAMNVKTGVISAVKQIVLGSQQEEQKLEQITILKKLDHPNIVSYLEHYKIRNQTWIFMEYVPTNLRNFYIDFGPPPVEVFLKFAWQIIEALAYLQKKNVMHKDIKCQNILLDNQGTLKLCDFGCSKGFGSTMSLELYQKNQAVKSFKGSYFWTAPQCLIGKVCLASDIWSLGCSLVELASGRPPWHQRNFDNPLQAVKFIVEHDQVPEIKSDWDPRVKQIITLCLKRKPEERIKATELLERKNLFK